MDGERCVRSRMVPMNPLRWVETSKESDQTLLFSFPSTDNLPYPVASHTSWPHYQNNLDLNVLFDPPDGHGICRVIRQILALRRRGPRSMPYFTGPTKAFRKI